MIYGFYCWWLAVHNVYKKSMIMRFGFTTTTVSHKCLWVLLETIGLVIPLQIVEHMITNTIICIIIHNYTSSCICSYILIYINIHINIHMRRLRFIAEIFGCSGPIILFIVAIFFFWNLSEDTLNGRGLTWYDKIKIFFFFFLPYSSRKKVSRE